MEGSGYRLAVLEDGTWHPHAYADVFGLEPPYLVAAPVRSPLSLAVALTEAMSPPFRLELEVLEPEGLQAEDGEVIEIQGSLSREDLAQWVDSRAPLLESDARLAVLIHGSNGERIVYDEHNRLLLTGPTLDFEAILLSQGLIPGDISVPMPHAHRYRDDLTPALSVLISR